MAEASRTAARETTERFERLVARNARNGTLTEEQQMSLFNQQQHAAQQQATAETPVPSLQSGARLLVEMSWRMRQQTAR